MTAIFYNGSALYADRMMITDTVPAMRSKGSKIFMGLGNMFAWAKDNQEVYGKDTRTEIEHAIYLILMLFSMEPTLGRIHRADLPQLETIEEAVKRIPAMKIIAIGKKMAVNINTHANGFFISNQNTSPCATGSGGQVLHGLATIWPDDIDRCFQRLPTLDPLCSSDYDVVRQEDLDSLLLNLDIVLEKGKTENVL